MNDPFLHPRKQTILKVVVLGDSGVGKSSLLERYVNHKFTALYKATIGSDFMTKEIPTDGNKVLMLQIWDTAGQERFQSLGRQFYRGADCCLLVYDVGILDSFYSLDRWREEFIVQSGLTAKELETFPFVLVGNKIDRPDRAVSKKMAQDWCQTNGQVPYIETSAKDAVNVDEAFGIVADAAMAHHVESPVTIDHLRVDLGARPKRTGVQALIDRCACGH
eukprot:TRINITY_DN907_c0_g1_i1.p1 TRINITY_DN907_c0_g1~~TRINITY_DN907_c0_g1_i1.p1  ORF type:complete len:220 (-),score=34.69 TRINITY_DN907_c0_g1_i1:346-1005(-)